MKSIFFAGLTAVGLCLASSANAAVAPTGNAAPAHVSGAPALTQVAETVIIRRGPRYRPHRRVCKVYVTRHRTPRGVVVRRVRRCM